MSTAHTLLPQQLRKLIGESAARAYAAVLLAHQNVRGCTLFRYTSPPRLQARIDMGAFEQNIVEQALALKHLTPLPFWELVFVACLERGECSQALLKAALFHNGPGVGKQYSRADISAGILELQEVDENVGLGSLILVAQQSELHLNMLDFHCDVADVNTRIVHQICRELFPTGFLISASGDSYHAVGLDLVTPGDRIVTLGKALLFNPIVDAFYVGHQLQQPYSSIRISYGGKLKTIPTVVDAWYP